MNRRDMLKSLATVSSIAPSLSVAAARQKKRAMGLVIHSFAARTARPLEPQFPSINDVSSFVEYAAKLGAAGVQTRINLSEPQRLTELRDLVARHEMYLEGTIALPKDESDGSRFESEAAAARAAGATVIRTVCLNGRRYETFERAEQFREFAERSWQSLVLAEPIVARLKVRLAVENHKDWRIDEMIRWLKRLSSEYIGVTLDTGNSIALLEDPNEVVDALAPWTMTTHFKDMGVSEYTDGFLLSEVPLGDGFLDLRRIATTVHNARPEARLNLEMITRDPLRVPCLTAKYWATLGDVRGRELADALARVRRFKHAGSLPEPSKLSHAEQLELEAANVIRSLDYAQKADW